MLHDFRQLDSPATIEADLAIIGAGAAGITLAHALIDSGIDCCLIESGGEEFDADVQSLYETEVLGVDDGQTCRLRYLGGSTNHWGGWCAPLNKIDFQERPWISHSGWPIDKSDIEPFYVQAQKLCRLGDYVYAVEQLTGDQRDFDVFHGRKLVPRLYQFSEPPVRFGDAYRSELERARNVRLYLNANVIRLAVDESASQVTSAVISTLDGRRGEIRARRFVLACGAIENTRLLLVSADTVTRGLGNSAGLVGRFFIQHPHVDCADLLAAVPEKFARRFKKFTFRGHPMRCSIGPSAEAQRTAGILNCSATLHAVSDLHSGHGAARSLWADIKRGRWPDEFAAKLWTVIADLGSVGGEATTWTVRMRSEQSPDPASRISLSSERDRLGVRKSKVDWRLSALDKRTVRIGAQLIGEEVGRLNWGRVHLREWLTDDARGFPASLWGGCHHMGTTRMADHPSRGVVDPNCRVHEVANLYIAGSSVFPTGGYANPTLSIIALTLRLAEHLKHTEKR